MSSISQPAGLDVERCADALTSILRVWGRFAINTPDSDPAEIGAALEGWARHVLLATPPPGREKSARADQARDWTGLTSFASDTRRGEQEYVFTRLRDLRYIVWVFIDVFARSMGADSKADARVMERLERLREAAKSDDLAELRGEALRAASVIEGAIKVRESRYKSHVGRLSSRLEKMSAELLETREKGALDALTGLYNRAALDEQLETIANLGRLVGDTAIAFMIDIDHFKWVNDKFGHSVGDELLRRIGRGLSHALRRKVDFVARYGGDEFVSIVHGGTDQQMRDTAERIAFAIREVEVQNGGEPVRVSASIGGARLRNGDTPEEWLKRADAAMYEAKHQGGDSIVIGTAAADEAPEAGADEEVGAETEADPGDKSS